MNENQIKIVKLNTPPKKKFVLLIAWSIVVFNSFICCSRQHEKFALRDVCAEHNSKKEVNVILFLFFSEKNCSDCLHQVIDILNKLPPYFVYYGVVLNNHGDSYPDLFSKNSLKTKIIEFSKLNDDIKLIYPALAGYKKNGDIIFILPLSFVNPQFLEEYLYSLYYNNVGLERKLN